MLIRDEALKLSNSFVVETNLEAFANLCRRLQHLYEMRAVLGFHEEFQVSAQNPFK